MRIYICPQLSAILLEFCLTDRVKSSEKSCSSFASKEASQGEAYNVSWMSTLRGLLRTLNCEELVGGITYPIMP